MSFSLFSLLVQQKKHTEKKRLSFVLNNFSFLVISLFFLLKKSRTTEKNFGHPRRIGFHAIAIKKKTTTENAPLVLEDAADGQTRGRRRKENYFSSTIFPSASMTLSFRNLLPSLRT